MVRGEQRLSRLRRKRLIPRQLEVWGLLDHLVIEEQPLTVLRAGELGFESLYRWDGSDCNKIFDLLIVQNGLFEIGNAILRGFGRF